jgi:pimeloyl-ACP methyl ester carboxylesterase
MMDTKTRVFVHLVHGTWPHGLLRRRSSQAKKAWFEDGSIVRANIQSHVDTTLNFPVFSWSGRNSYAARSHASIEFSRYIDSWMKKEPEAKHIVIAHSHGGTVAARGIAELRHRLGDEPRIKALVCLATPFVYLSYSQRAKRAQRFYFGSALSFMAWAGVLMVGLRSWDRMLSYNWFGIVGIGVAATMFLHVVFALCFPSLPSRYWGEPAIHPKIPVFLARATRDEASLTIGLTQSIHWMSAQLYALWQYDFFEKPFPLLIPRGVLALILLFLGGTALSAAVRAFLVPLLSVGQFWSVSAFLAEAIAGLLYLLGYAIVALSVGLTEFWVWPGAMIEVDAAPRDKECSFKSYSEPDAIQTTSLRHGLYESLQVQWDIASIIRGVVEDSKPRFLTEEESEALEREVLHSRVANGSP